ELLLELLQPQSLLLELGLERQPVRPPAVDVGRERRRLLAAVGERVLVHRLAARGRPIAVLARAVCSAAAGRGGGSGRLRFGLCERSLPLDDACLARDKLGLELGENLVALIELL